MVDLGPHRPNGLWVYLCNVLLNLYEARREPLPIRWHRPGSDEYYYGWIAPHIDDPDWYIVYKDKKIGTLRTSRPNDAGEVEVEVKIKR